VRQQVGPPAVGEVLDLGHAWSRFMASAINRRIAVLRVIPSGLRESNHWICDGESLMESGFSSFNACGSAECLRNVVLWATVSTLYSLLMQHWRYGDHHNLIEQTEALENLNFLQPASCEGYGLLRESSICDLTEAQVRPVFRNIESELVEQINKHDFIVGCVAWLTSVSILEALQSKKVQFIVQQEDWLRPDSDEWSMSRQRSLYKNLKGIENIVADASWCACFDIQPIRLSGKPKNKQRSNARMHHKFVLFGKETEDWGASSFDLVWTGSYNFTANATKSLENGLFIKSEEVVKAYYQEWRQVLLSSFRIEDRWWGESYGWSSDDEYLRDGT
jgi:hypothetical protein